jgi:predicted HTH domain antitoxin
MAIHLNSCYAHAMQITVQLPDDLAQLPDPGREALISLAIEGYRSGALSHHQAGQLLGLSRLEFEGLLKERDVHDHAYSPEDLEEDSRTLHSLQSKGLLRQ